MKEGNNTEEKEKERKRLGKIIKKKKKNSCLIVHRKIKGKKINFIRNALSPASYEENRAENLIAHFSLFSLPFFMVSRHEKIIFVSIFFKIIFYHFFHEPNIALDSGTKHNSGNGNKFFPMVNL